MDPGVLVARAGLLANLSVFLGVAGHVSAGGLLPGPLVLVLIATFAVVPCIALLRRPAGPLRIVLLLMGGQTGVHVALTLTAGHVGDPARSPAAVAGRSPLSLPTVDGHRVGSLQDAYQSSIVGSHGVSPTLPVGHLLDDVHSHAPMMAAHLLVAALLGLWLAVGERALWTLLALAAAFAVAPLRLVSALVGVGAPVVVRLFSRVHSDPPPRTEILCRTLSRRGPPHLLAA